MRAVATHCGTNRARSAMPPETIAGIAAAKVQQEEELDQGQALRVERCGAVSASAPTKKCDAVGDGVADEEVGDRRDREVDQDLARAR